MDIRISPKILFLACFAFFVTPVLPLTQNVYLNSLDIYVTPFVLLSFVLLGFTRRIFVTIVYLVLILFGYLLALEFIYQSGDPTGILVFLRLIPGLVVAYMLAYWFYTCYREDSLKYFFYFVLIIALVQGGVLWISFFNDEFRALMDSIFWRSPDAAYHLVYLRVPAFSPSGGDGLGMNQALLCLMATGSLYYIQGYKKLMVLMGILLSMIGTVFTARYGLLVGLPILVLLFLNEWKSSMLTKAAILLFLLVSSLTTVYLLLPLISEWANLLILLNGYEDPLARALSGFRNYGSSGEIEFATLRVLFVDMMLLPDDPFRFLFGNGDFGQMAVNTIDADSGYVRMLFGMGAVGTLTYLMLLLYAVLSVVKKLYLADFQLLNRSRLESAKSLAIYVILIALFIMLGHFKIMYIHTRIVTVLFFTLIFLLHLVFSQVSVSPRDDVLPADAVGAS